MTVDTRWLVQFKAKDDDAKKKVKASLSSAKHILDAAVSIIEKQQKALERPTLEDYNCPSWSHRQAHINGEIAGLNKVISLLTIKGN